MLKHRVWVAAALAAGVLNGCGFDLGDIDRTQPNKLRKEVFTGDWYYRQTVLSVPYASGVTFAGEQNDPTELIRWDIQERFLIAYRAYDLIAGTDTPSVLPGDKPTNTPVAVFAIESHFDIQREYNAQTGEQTNVLVENTTDRPWHERAMFRVDWSQNLSPNFNFIINGVTLTPGGHYVQLPGDPDALLLARITGEDPATGAPTWEERQGEGITQFTQADYLDVVQRLMVTPQTLVVEDYDGTLLEEPACWYYGNVDCFATEVKVRSAFLKRRPNSYVPKHFPDNEILRDEDGKPITVNYIDRDTLRPDPDGFIARASYFDKFGYFRTERDTYDRLQGETNTGRLALINRFNMWRDTPGCITPDSDTPFANCHVKPIVYHLSAGFPEDMKPAARVTADEWNKAFKQTVRALKYGDNRPLSEVEEGFILKENSFKADGAKVLTRGERIGDLRYNFMAWVDEPTQVGLLGYGPSANDPLTGETIAASAFVYGAAVDMLAQRSKDIIDLINDPTRLTDVLAGEDVMRDVLLRTASDDNARDATHRFSQEKLHTPRQRAVKRLGKQALRTDGSRTRARMDALKDTPLESRLINDAIVRAFNNGRPLDGPLSAEQKERFSPRTWAMGARQAREKRRRLHLARHKAEPMNFFDTSVVGLAKAYKDEDPATVLLKLREAIFRSTMEHEVGHTLGLRHNFEATTDALNYGRRYWDLRGENGQALDPLTPAQSDGRMREYQYSSIMDYGSRFMSDITGLGLYDEAAIAFGYGDLVEVLDGAEPDEPLLYLASLDDIIRHWRHYTRLPDMLGGIDGMHQRKLVPHSKIVDQLAGRANWTLWEIPYRFCSDEYDGATATCATYDEGADAYEIALGARAQYLEYFPLLSFSRDRRGFNEWDYMDRVSGRALLPMLTQYQNWVFDQFSYESGWDCARSDDADCDDDSDVADAAYFRMENVPWSEAGDAGLPGTAATRLLLDLLAEMVATPEPGSYKYDTAEGVQVLWWYGDVDRCPAGSPGPDCSDGIIPFGTGRYTDSRWDFDSGYYFYDRLQMVGSFYDKLVALETAITADTYFLGVDSGADVARYLIGLNLYFPEEIYQLMGGASTQDYARFSGVTCLDTGAYEPPTLSRPNTQHCNGSMFQHVDPATSFTVELYAIWLGMAFLPGAFDTSFNDRIKIWLDGSGEAITPADPALVTTFRNPINNRVYKTSCVADPNAYCPGKQILTRAQAFADAFAMDPSLDNRYRLENLVTTIEDIRGTYDVYGYLFF